MTNAIVNFVSFFIILEISIQFLIKYFRKEFQWLVIEKDTYPKIDKKAFRKFIDTTFDKELGWTRKPNSAGIERGKFNDIRFQIDENGSRKNHINSETSVVSFGDSYTFCRQVEDSQTWQVYLSKSLDDKVLNFGNGNYGVDQALLRYKREKLPETTKLVILGFVPETICRIHSYWKHYLEFGNTFAFKPRFTFKNGKLKLHKNLISGFEDIHNIEKIINKAQEHDVFYERKFKRLQFRFPYMLSYLFNLKRNTVLLYFLIKRKLFSIFNISKSEIENAPFSKIMHENIKDSHRMYSEKEACDLLEAILLEFCRHAEEQGHTPLLLLMPQLLDMQIIQKTKFSPYEEFFNKISKTIPLIDMTHYLNNSNLNDLYTDDVYGGHFSDYGNKQVADRIFKHIKNELII
jgi:hypothetical protein